MPNAHTNNITAIITVAKITIHGMLYTANITFRIKDKLSTIKLFKKIKIIIIIVPHILISRCRLLSLIDILP